MVVPCETTNSSCVSGHSTDPLAIFSIPDLHRAALCADSYGAALSVVQLPPGWETYWSELTLFVHSKPVITSLTSSPLGVLVVMSQSLVTLLVCALQR